MKKTILILAAMLLMGVSCDKSHVNQAQAPVVGGDTELDREIRKVMEKGINLEERRRQVPAIAAAFARRTNPERARWLAALCYLKTLGTSFMPMDLAEIALAETGNHRLSARAVSHKGALGVWQLMPYRARSHGYEPEDMADDEKCAAAAVRELLSKMDMAKGDLVRAKKLYCGVGPAANAYEAKRRQFRREILDELGKLGLKEAVVKQYKAEQPS
ncbi:lytic transglycosylase lipoprotein, putative [Geotalea daltonii FRC-32]|uniref:Lytic transglycosylase lipoprotein, putative n=1 Tax=Geotalea daltonii (strain DSM 22248 / JCM 15807 / FRC-32) TaxID=316067 RepID=B9M7C8_GEODF|nr:transglycosylase SLT domain-containing protein [Geotalea daltonii]ACM20216.1 lytic transglycosylase lipoprotein, putative [Geotalea daltonii FRC-32]